MLKEVKEIQQALLSSGRPAHIEFAQKIVPGTEKVYGVRTPVLHTLATKYRSGSFKLAEELWKAGALEEKLIAIKIIEKTAKQDPEKTFALLKQFAKNIGNWAVCDGLGLQFLAGVRRTHTEEIFSRAEKFIRSKDPWQRRLALVMVEWYTRLKEYHPKIKALIQSVEKDEEYYVKKAVKWITRNFTKGK